MIDEGSRGAIQRTLTNAMRRAEQLQRWCSAKGEIEREFDALLDDLDLAWDYTIVLAPESKAA